VCRFRRRRLAAGVCAAALAVAGVAGCGSGAKPGAVSATGTGAVAAARYTTPLKGICPDTVTIQAGWWPEPDEAFLYQLFGPHPTIDRNANRIVGPLGATGVRLEVRAGGPARGFQPMSSLLAQDDTILLGVVGTDEAIQNSGAHPTVAVFTGYENSPFIFLWGDPTWRFRTVADVGRSGARVLASAQAGYLEVFEREGLLHRSQVDTSYDSGPARFVAAGGKIVQQGFVTSEPYRLHHDVKSWGKPVHYLLFGRDYPVYIVSLAVRRDRLAANRACLAKLVPLLQRAQRDYVTDPGPTNRLVLDAVSRMNTGGFTLSPGLVADANAKQRDLGLIANGTDGVLGSFDTGRVQRLIGRLAPAFAQGSRPKPGLNPADLVTNEFLDRSVSLR
jgi:hypothetical protein